MQKLAYIIVIGYSLALLVPTTMPTMPTTMLTMPTMPAASRTLVAGATATPATAIPSTPGISLYPLLVRVRDAAGQPLAGAVVRLYWQQGAVQVEASTNSEGITSFAAVGPEVVLRLLPGQSGAKLVNAEAQSYSSPPLRFKTAQGHIAVFASGAGWVYPDAATGSGLPITPVVRGNQTLLPRPYTQNEEEERQGQATSTPPTLLDPTLTSASPSSSAVEQPSGATPSERVGAAVASKPQPPEAGRARPANTVSTEGDNFGGLACYAVLAGLVALGYLVMRGAQSRNPSRRIR